MQIHYNLSCFGDSFLSGQRLLPLKNRKSPRLGELFPKVTLCLKIQPLRFAACSFALFRPDIRFREESGHTQNTDTLPPPNPIFH